MAPSCPRRKPERIAKLTTNRLHAPAGAITDFAGIEVGHFTTLRRPTGCTVILTRAGAVAGVDVCAGNREIRQNSGHAAPESRAD